MIDDQKNTPSSTGIICGVVIERDGTYLLVQEKKSHVYGKWNLPSGRLKKGETLEQAAIREAKEETGFDIRITRALRTLQAAPDRPALYSFQAEIVGGTLHVPKSELLDAKWFSYDEIIRIQADLRNIEYVLGSVKVTRQVK